ncbi:MAG: DNA-directed RNA polymerase subunit delta [Erysipelotrichaceae bacterium]|jgi:DNA-directed RNA polymerase subunit delta|nr:DNA-directed RNA polymerase subunit delta [Bacillota bacterium]MDY0118333.1 DNA-directed RNA polymerase subunit delta [Bacilli bacterium]NLJ32234.1 DNA-directed RNA polymerase subunit delta [Erysipelotrichaceae bacterium]HOF65634.1 DNA-directed RNA polymerase subunit delta [Bacilli bacterium]
MKSKSNLEIVFEILSKSKEPLTFEELWEEVCVQKDYSEEEKIYLMSVFYTNLSLDGRFVNVRDNTWDLRERVLYDDVHLSMYDFYTTEDEEDDEESDFDDDGEPIRLRVVPKKEEDDDEDDQKTDEDEEI